MNRVVVVLPLTPVTATIGIRADLALREQAVDDRLAHRARLARGGLQVHPQPGAGVHFDDHARLALQRLGDVHRHDVHAGDVQADHPRGVDGPGGDFRMDLVGHVGGGAAGAQVGVAADQHARRRPAAPSRACSLARPARPGRSAPAGSWSARWRGRRCGADRDSPRRPARGRSSGRRRSRGPARGEPRPPACRRSPAADSRRRGRTSRPRCCEPSSLRGGKAAQDLARAWSGWSPRRDPGCRTAV